MTCAEFKEQAHAMALGALEPGEREACERHLASPGPHDGCADALQRAEAAAALLAIALPRVDPGEVVWRRIASKIGSRIAEPRARPWRFIFGGIGWAAAVAAAGLVVWNQGDRRGLVARLGESERQRSALTGEAARLPGCLKDLRQAQGELGAHEAALALLERPDTQVVALAAQAGRNSRASAIFNPKEGRAVLVATGLAAEPGKDYELWVIRGSDKLPAGLLHADPHGLVLAQIDGRLLSGGIPDAFAVTLEPLGGSPSPRGPILLVGAPSKG